MYTCDLCKDKNCRVGLSEKYPKNCPTRESDNIEKLKPLYNDEENHNISYNSALVESEGYCRKTRLEEIMDFADKCNYKKLGLAFCSGLSNEGKILAKILKANGFEVISVMCKSGSISKEFIGIKEDEKVRPGSYEPMCNPIGQATFLNNSNTDLNIVLGLCVGHDSLFFKYSEAPTTVFAVKDRVLGHNPIAALYLSDSYYKDKLYPKD